MLKQQKEKLDKQLRQSIEREEVKASKNALKPRLNEEIGIDQTSQVERSSMKNDILRPLKSHHLFIQGMSGLDEHQN